MKKKFLLGLLVIVTLFTITGCGTNEVNEPKQNGSKNDVSSMEKLKVGNVEVELNMSGSFNDITYKYPQSALTSNVGTYSIIDYMDNNIFVFRIAMSLYDGKTIDEVMKGSSLSNVEALKFNDNTWNIFKGKQEDGKNILNFVTRENNDSYSIAFISDEDISDFANEFMKNVRFN